MQRQLAAEQAALTNCLATQPAQSLSLVVDLIDAMIGSATMPVFFPPVVMARDCYVDGGLREVIPIQSVLDCGANTVFAIEASRSAIAPVSYADVVTLPAIALRSTLDIAINEVA